MSNPITLTETRGAWLGSAYQPHEFAAALTRGDESGAAGMLLFSSSTDCAAQFNWTKVGEAQITVTLMPQEEQVRAAVESLQRRLQQERADSQRRQQEILAAINKLQALTFEAA